MRLRKKLRKSPPPPGQAPGTPVHVGERLTEGTTIQVYSYDKGALETVTTQVCTDCFRFQKDPRITWLHVTGLHESAKISRLGEAFGLHALVIEDILNTHGRSKVDELDDALFVVTRIITPEPASGGVDHQHLALYIAPNLVISFSEAPTKVFAPVMQRIAEGKGRIRGLGGDYLAWAILDAVVDNYFAVIDTLDQRLQTLDQDLQDGADDVETAQLYRLRSEVTAFHRLVRPVREIASALAHSESPLLTEGSAIYYRDLYDHAVHVLDHADDLREMSSSLRDFYLSIVNNRMNEIMKVLACVSTVFLPLTFLAGMYGMNFHHMPELDEPWAYPAVWAICFIIAGGMFWFFRRRNWL